MYQSGLLQLHAPQSKSLKKFCSNAQIISHTPPLNLVFQPISRDLRRELYSRRRGDGVPKRKSRKEAKEVKEAKEGNKENQNKATPPQPESKSNVSVKKAGKC